MGRMFCATKYRTERCTTTLDLHGLNQAMAHSAVRMALQHFSISLEPWYCGDYLVGLNSASKMRRNNVVVPGGRLRTALALARNGDVKNKLDSWNSIMMHSNTIPITTTITLLQSSLDEAQTLLRSLHQRILQHHWKKM
jgi:hypothetical protein